MEKWLLNSNNKALGSFSSEFLFWRPLEQTGYIPRKQNFYVSGERKVKRGMI